MNFNELTKPGNALNVLNSVGLVRIPFNSVNSNIHDMISSFGTGILNEDIIGELTSKGFAREKVNLSTSYFYIFRSSQYAMFLKLIAKEYSMSKGMLTCTSESDVLFSTQQDCSYDNCPTFTLEDSDEYDNIETSIYSKYFSKQHTHLCKLTTRKQAIGIKPVKLTEVFLFIP